jgi:flagellin
MPISVNTNTNSLSTQRYLENNRQTLGVSFARLASGLRINSAKDDAAGLAVAEGLNGVIRGQTVALRNAQDGISLGQIAETALGTIANSLQRIREIAVQASNGTISDTDRGLLQREVDQLTQEISRTVSSTRFGTATLLDTSVSGGIRIQIGAGSADTITVSGASLSTLTSFDGVTAAGSVSSISGAASLTGAVNITTSAGAIAALSRLDSDIQTITGLRATYGAVQNRFENVINNLSVSIEAQSAARGRIVDTDFAAETSALTRNQVLTSASQAILSQANQLPQQALQLLRQ